MPEPTTATRTRVCPVPDSDDELVSTPTPSRNCCCTTPAGWRTTRCRRRSAMAPRWPRAPSGLFTWGRETRRDVKHEVRQPANVHRNKISPL